jgi:hypothetical protein
MILPLLLLQLLQAIPGAVLPCAGPTGNLPTHILFNFHSY